MMSPRAEHADAIRTSVERLLRGAATENLEMLGLEHRKLEEALARLTSELERSGPSATMRAPRRFAQSSS